MNSSQPAPGSRALDSTTRGSNWTRRLVNVLVALVVIAVAGATFVFSYNGVHAIALLGGVSTQLARYYPGLFDAVLVIACVAAVILRDGRWWARLWAWAVVVIILGAIGTADVLHAMNYTLRHRPTEGIVAAAPVAAVLLAFSLLLTLLRQSKAPAPSAAPTVPLDVPALPVAVSAPLIALPAAPAAFRPIHSAAATEPTIPLPVPATAAEFGPPTEPAPPTVMVPTVTLPSMPRSQGIRYAGGGTRNTPPSADYWETEDTEQFAGLVYRARDDDDDDDDARDDEPDEDRHDDADDDATEADETEDALAEEPAARPNRPDLDDAPPFATAPFASVPRLNRVRSMPTPPADEDE